MKRWYFILYKDLLQIFKKVKICPEENISVGYSPYALPIILPIIVPGSLLITFAISTSLGHVNPWIPTITNTGVRYPEILIFSMFMNLYSFLGLLDVIIRYEIMKTRLLFLSPIMPDWFCSCTQFLNTIGMLCGVTSVAGIFLVGNCEPSYSQLIHVIGSVIAFGPGPVYCLIYATLYFIGNRRNRLALARFGFAFGVTICSIMHCYYALKVRVSTKVGPKDPNAGFLYFPRETDGSGGKFLHKDFPLVGDLHSLSEWGIVLFYALFNLTYVWVYRDYRIPIPRFAWDHRLVSVDGEKNDNLNMPHINA